MTIEYPDGTQLVITKEFAAPPARVFKAFTDADVMKGWIWGDDPSGVQVESDPRVGGRWTAYVDAKEGDDSWPGDRWGMCGVYAVVDAPTRIVYTLHWDAPVGYNIGDDVGLLTDEAVVVDLRSTDTGTEVKFRHIGIPDDRVAAHEHARGVANTFETLERLLSDQ